MSGRLLAALLLIITCNASQTEARPMSSSNRIDAIFSKTKPVCFGRFVMDVPDDAEFIFGDQSFGPPIESIKNGSKELKILATKKKDEVLSRVGKLDRSELIDLREFPNRGSWVVRFWDSDTAKEVGVQSVWTFLNAEPDGFLIKYSTSASEGRTEDVLISRISYLASALRSRQPDEIPTEPGVCLDLGFIKDDSGKFQEIFNIGLRFPSMPDVSFSISSNKDARRYSSFEERRSEARKAALLYAPFATLFSKVKTLREGKHKVYKWQGDEALFRHPLDEGKGVWHEFQFEYAGIRYDHHNPGWDAALFSGVKDDEAGAQASSLSDEEAVELWDRLLSTVRLRVPE